MFRDHHYLSGDINKSSRCWIAVWNDVPVGFSANLALPSGSLRDAWKGHRTVVLPDFQGLGFGVRISEAIAEIFLSEGKRYFTKTAHPRLGEYREASPKWRGTSHNKKERKDYIDNNDNALKNNKYSEELLKKHTLRVTYAHEYIGEKRVDT
jgi:GNAT superfamily N-acetyltransferase